MGNVVEIRPQMITWALDRAGLDVVKFMQKHPKFTDISLWISEKKKPTVKKLKDFADMVHVPFGYMFLDEPPQETLPFPYFRTGSKSHNVSINVFDTIQLISNRQAWLSDYLKDNESDVLPFVGAFKGNNDIDGIVKSIRDVLGLEVNWASSHSTWQAALSHLVNTIEAKGIVTVFNGIYGYDNHRKIEVDECRGFVIVDEYAPFMFVNSSDSKAAQMFTIVHELAHIWTGQSAGFDFRMLQPSDDPNEKLCDKVAAEFLVPKKAFYEKWRASSDIAICSKYFKVSEIVIARRALDLGLITKSEFFDFYNAYKARESFIKASKSKNAQPDFFVLAKKRTSKIFAEHILNALKSGYLLHREAYKLTNMRGDTFEQFFNKQIIPYA